MTATRRLPRRSAEEQARLEAMLREMFEHRLCFNEVLGFKVESLDPAAAAISFAMRPDLIGHYLHGRLHGGVISTALDTVGGLAVMVGDSRKVHQRNDRAGGATASAGSAPSTCAPITCTRASAKNLRPPAGLPVSAAASPRVQMTLENEAGLLIATGGGSYVIS